MTIWQIFPTLTPFKYYSLFQIQINSKKTKLKLSLSSTINSSYTPKKAKTFLGAADTVVTFFFHIYLKVTISLFLTQNVTIQSKKNNIEDEFLLST